MGNDESLLYETLQDFIDYYGDAGEVIRIALNEERYTDAEILSHTLKGLGGLDAKVDALDMAVHGMVTEIRQVLSA